MGTRGISDGKEGRTDGKEGLTDGKEHRERSIGFFYDEEKTSSEGFPENVLPDTENNDLNKDICNVLSRIYRI